MKIHYGELGDVTRYLDRYRHIQLQEKEAEYKYIADIVERFKKLDNTTQILEIGSGMGWLPVMCAMKGIPCKGIEISPQLVAHGRQTAEEHGVKPNIELGNIEDYEIGRNQYDVIIATSVFEHVELWQDAIRKVYAALKPGGILYFYSTNKFSPKSGEHDFPLYGWMPNSWRFALRRKRQGEDIMKLGIDFNQFTYIGLRRFFRSAGFRRIHDQIDLRDPEHLVNPKPWKIAALKIMRAISPVKQLGLIFAPGTLFVCEK